MSSYKPVRKRASNACVRCHGSKLKCDVTTRGVPCSRCSKEGNKCEVFPSKRNSFRRQFRTPSPRHELIMAPLSQLIHQGEVSNQTDDFVITQDGNLFDVNYWPMASTSAKVNASNGSGAAATSQLQETNIVISPGEKSSSKEFSDVWLSQSCQLQQYQQHAQHHNHRSIHHHHHFVNKNSFTFIGESSPLAMVLRRLQDSGHISVGIIPRKHLTSSSPQSCSSGTSQSTEMLEELISSFFTFVHPYYPMINRIWFFEEYTKGTISQLLFNAVCFAACYHCDSSTIFKCGFNSREDAKDVFYRLAKKLFDEEQEQDVLIVLQSVVLLSFYGGRPRQLWNSRTWVSLAISIAEDLGIHRSTRRSQLSDMESSQLRIIWWCVVLRDLMTSLTLGRPPRICQQRCDVEPLTLEDFDVDKDPDSSLFGKRSPSCYHYLIEISKLNIFMDEIIEIRYNPRSSLEPDMSRFHRDLLEWKKNLPDCVNRVKNETDSSALYLEMAYHHLLIFIFRPRMVGSEIAESCSLEECVKSANEIASCVGNLGVMRSLSIPQDIYPIIVTAMVILIQDYRCNNSIISKLHLQICMIAIKQSCENWDHGSWLLDVLSPMLKMDEKEHEMFLASGGETSKPSFDNFDVLSSYFMSNNQ